MPDLKHSLGKLDFTLLKIIAEKWGVDLEAGNAREAVLSLQEALLDPELVRELVESLPARALKALAWLEEEEGQRKWSHFLREFGEIREMGAGRMERDRPDRAPVSPAEVLWYRALVGRGFFETEAGPQEFAYIPADLRGILQTFLERQKKKTPGTLRCRQATDRERAVALPVQEDLLDHFCTLLAARRMKHDPGIHLPGVGDLQIEFLRALADIAGLIDQQGNPDPDQIRAYFSLGSGEAILKLWQAWRDSREHHDLQHTPGIVLETYPDYSPVQVRTGVLAMLGELEEGTWWSLSSFTAQVKAQHPDFLRTAGEYDAWFIKDADGEEFLRGFEYWDAVEGALLRYLITGPLHWLGFLDLAVPEEQAAVSAFRRSKWADPLLGDRPPAVEERGKEQVQIRSMGEIRVTKRVPQRVRYQLARFCQWRPIVSESYRYNFTPASLEQAEKQGLRIVHLLTLLENHTETIPPNILTALKRWEKKGAQAAVHHQPILRVNSPEVLAQLQESRAKRFLLEELGPTAVTIQQGSEEKIAEVLVELGYFTAL